MSEGIAAFVGPSRRQPGNHLTYSVSFVRPDGQPGLDTGTTLDIWQNAVAACAPLEIAYIDALQRNTGFPGNEATFMHGTLGWHQGLQDLIDTEPSALRLMLNRETCRLLPELCPVQLDSSTWSWLDRELPIYRSLHHVPRVALPRQQEMSLAVLYQEKPEWEGVAGEIHKNLAMSFRRIDLFPGNTLADPVRRTGELQRIFFGHRAVLFLGHLDEPRPGHQGGWCLNGEVALPIAELTALLASVGAVIPSRGQSIRSALSVPDLVLTACCSGRCGLPVAGGANDFFYPEGFLGGGVRFFVGTWMKVYLPEPEIWVDLAALIAGFLRRWSQDPDAAPRALFEAKRADCPNELLASLFQLYIAPEVPTTTTPAPVSAPARPLTAELLSGGQLGSYRLIRKLWQDPSSAAFWAEQLETRSQHLVQVLADEWQGRPDLEDLLQNAIATLCQAGLSTSHLIPARVEALQRGGDTAAPTLWALIYDRPGDETANTWGQLAEPPAELSGPERFQWILELGAAVSRSLAELHAVCIPHGNFDRAAVLLRHSGGKVQVAIKDAWVHWVQTGRCTHPRYAAPDALDAGEPGRRLKVDCYGLGVLMFELATGQPREPSKVSLRGFLGHQKGLVPEALDRVVCECLAPVAAVRPPADQIARRLALAVSAGGTYLGDLGRQFDLHIAAGHRLFAVRVDRTDDVQRVFEALTADLHAHFRYRLYVAAEGEGVRDCRLGPVLNWIDAAKIRAAITQQTGQDPGLIQADTECYVNATELLDWMSNLVPADERGDDPRRELPIVLFRGASWWQAAPSMADVLNATRTFKASQRERGYPAVVIADSQLLLPADAGIPFVLLDFPPPAPSELFERVLSAPHALGCPPLDPDQAAMVADRLFPCTARELDDALRFCAVRHGRIDEQVVDVRDEDRARRFHGLGPLTYTPRGQLPAFDTFGWPPEQAPKLAYWCAALRDIDIGPRCLLLTGASGYGKSAAPRALAAGLRRPLFRLDAASCLQRNLGASEQALALNLDMVSGLGSVVLLLDDLHKLVSATDSTLTRMSGILSHWIDHLHAQLVVVATATSVEDLPAPWRRRFPWTIALDEPLLDQPTPTQPSLTYRSLVIAALFRRFGLTHLAEDTSLLDDLARRTCHAARSAPLKDPLARLRPAGPLGGFEIRLSTGADLEAWMADTMQIFIPETGPDAPANAEFWREAAG